MLATQRGNIITPWQVRSTTEPVAVAEVPAGAPLDAAAARGPGDRPCVVPPSPSHLLAIAGRIAVRARDPRMLITRVELGRLHVGARIGHSVGVRSAESEHMAWGAFACSAAMMVSRQAFAYDDAASMRANSLRDARTRQSPRRRHVWARAGGRAPHGPRHVLDMPKRHDRRLRYHRMAAADPPRERVLAHECARLERRHVDAAVDDRTPALRE